jgi:hypothetical protein
MQLFSFSDLLLLLLRDIRWSRGHDDVPLSFRLPVLVQCMFTGNDGVCQPRTKTQLANELVFWARFQVRFDQALVHYGHVLAQSRHKNTKISVLLKP